MWETQPRRSAPEHESARLSVAPGRGSQRAALNFPLAGTPCAQKYITAYHSALGGTCIWPLPFAEHYQIFSLCCFSTRIRDDSPQDFKLHGTPRICGEQLFSFCLKSLQSHKCSTKNRQEIVAHRPLSYGFTEATHMNPMLTGDSLLT